MPLIDIQQKTNEKSLIQHKNNVCSICCLQNPVVPRADLILKGKVLTQDENDRYVQFVAWKTQLCQEYTSRGKVLTQDVKQMCVQIVVVQRADLISKVKVLTTLEIKSKSVDHKKFVDSCTAVLQQSTTMSNIKKLVGYGNKWRDSLQHWK